MAKQFGKPFWIVLAVGAVALCAVWFVKKQSAPETIQAKLQDRMAVSGALNQAVVRIQAKTKEFPKSIAELKDEPELKALPSGALNGVTFDYVSMRGERAVYKLVMNGGKPKEVLIHGWMKSNGTPTLGGMSKAGG